ncbi:methyltransferase type 11 [Grosmannia clavigera kw1407]|uniref:Methyltransferase type 11 n=1 Tax=Grosmannia clavigera (strain kw1407 / UAMH 11150) TaxID=655863 RepID=F0XJS2_GROCL|nr:methyltransferase type 11 [Grosmannia clavigera kw1407]EFX02118.1 methyltransferase type 11 [Grosmannia clavigera kw1407]
MSSDAARGPVLAPTDHTVANTIAAAVVLAEGDDTNLAEDADLALGDNYSLSTASVSSSILQYRTINGRTFHSDKYANYFMPNDGQQQEAIDIAHHYLTLLLNGAFFLAPVKDNLKNVLDIGTGTGIWAIDVADQFPNAQVIGTDISPIQSIWVPPNAKFEIDDATQPWTWPDNAFDFVHIRFLVGAISDWDALFSQAYRCCEPGGWFESCELRPEHQSDNGTDKNSPIFTEFWQLFETGMSKLGRNFSVVKDGTQHRAMKKAGFKNIVDKTYKLPLGKWPADTKLAEIGQFALTALLEDLEGYTTFLWNKVLEKGEKEFQIFLMEMRKALKDKNLHTYFTVRYVYGQKPVE